MTKDPVRAERTALISMESPGTVARTALSIRFSMAPRNLATSTSSTRSGAGTSTQLAIGQDLCRLQQVGEEGAEVEVLQLEEVRFEGPPEHEQPLDQGPHVVELVHHHRDGVAHLVQVGIGLAGQHLEVAPGHGQRGPELMRDVGQQPSLDGHGGLETVEHRVERGRQLPDLVVGPLVPESPVQVTALRSMPPSW